MNADKFRELKRVYGITTQKAADIMDIATVTANRYLLKPDSPFYKPMPDSRIRLLTLVLRGRRTKV